MKLPEGNPARSRGLLHPRSWPVRWRLAGVSAGLTLFILVCFALIVGRLATDRLKDDFQNDLRGAASELALEIELHPTGQFGQFELLGATNLAQVALADDAEVRVVDRIGGVLKETPHAPDMGVPSSGMLRFGDYDVATFPIVNDQGAPPAYVQYARDHDDIDSTIGRLWLLLALGVAGGTVLAALAGVAVAGRAMRPIAALTSTAREIAATRDPSQRIPEPDRDDEIGELARTLDQMLRELDASRSETEQVVQAQREFIADASHELRTPLTSILANLELLHEQLSQTERAGEQGEIVASALSSSQRMRRLVADLLLLARADAGRAGTRTEVDLSEIAEAALAEVRPVAAEHHLELHAADGVSVDGNADELHRMALNLLDNGLRHTPEGSTIELTVASRNGDAVLEVTDDGPGVPAEQREHVFSRFARLAGPADLSADTGTGLGLAIVEAVARSHDGRVEVGSSASGGARFTVSLPPAQH
jgi:signal transduction histidine kinase